MAQLLDAPGTCRVLVVDDDRDAADSLVGMLKLWGFTAHAVYDGAQAVLADEALQPSLVLLDINMPSAGRLRRGDRDSSKLARARCEIGRPHRARL